MAQKIRTGQRVVFNSRLNRIRVRTKGTVVKNYVTAKTFLLKTEIGNLLKFSYGGNEVKMIGGFE